MSLPDEVTEAVGKETKVQQGQHLSTLPEDEAGAGNDWGPRKTTAKEKGRGRS